MLQYFAPKEIVHWGDVILAGGLAALLLSNAARMIWFVRRRAVPARAQDLVAELSEFFVQGATQRRWLECDTISRKHWLRHIALVAAYGTMFALVVVFLYWFQVQDASFHWTSLPGYLSTLLLLGATSWILLDRRRKHDQIHKDSDLADWLFVILLFLTALSGILLHGARLLNLAMATYVLYMVHLMIAVPMLVVEVPFSKWSHMLYRPLALYLLAVQRRTAPASQKQWSGHPAVTA